nr:hypothetical protein [Cellulomonas sp. HLT2-17]
MVCTRAQVVEGGDLDELAGTQDPDAVAQVLDLVEDVRGQEDGLPAGGRLTGEGLEHGFHERVEARCRLVEQQHVGSGHEGRDECDLLPVSLGVGPHAPGRVELEAVDELGAERGVDVAGQVAEQVEGLGSGELRPQGDVAGHVPDVAVGALDIADVDAHDLGGSAGRADQVQQQPHRGRLAGSIRAEKPERLALADLEVHPLEGSHGSEVLAQIVGRDRGCHRSSFS